MLTRVCNVCAKDFPRTPEFWNKQKRRRDGLDETCKTCANKRAKDWYVANRDRARAQHKQYRDQNHEQVLQGKLRYRQSSADKIRKHGAELYQRNRQKRIAYSAQWRKDNPEKAAASRKREYENNKEVIRQRAADWFRNNPEKIKARLARRDALEVNAPGHFTPADLREQRRKQAGLCFYCHVELDKRNESVDHVIPLSKGGTNYPENIVLACWPCNNLKRAKMPDQFLKYLKSIR